MSGNFGDFDAKEVALAPKSINGDPREKLNSYDAQIKWVDIDSLSENTGQIDGLPKNPRKISKEKMGRLKNSISAHPEFLAHNMLHVVETSEGGHYVVIGGNMRFKALKELGFKRVPVTVFPVNTYAQDLRAYALIDNNQFGEWDWDTLATDDWDWNELKESGLDFPKDSKMFEDERKAKETELLSDIKYTSAYYEPKGVAGLKLDACIDDSLVEKKRQVVLQSGLTDAQKSVLLKFCDRFRKIDFEGVANYFTFNANPDERDVMMRLRLVLVDDGSIAGFVEDGLLRVQESVFNSADDDDDDDEEND